MGFHHKRVASFPSTLHPEEWMWSIRRPKVGLLFSWLYQIALLVILGFLGYYFASRNALLQTERPLIPLSTAPVSTVPLAR